MASQTSEARKPVIAGNWKLHKTIKESIDFINELKAGFASEPRCEVIVAPPFTALAKVHDLLGDSFIQLAAQNLYWESQGAYTGEVSAPLLADCGCRYIIVGHSERRQLFLETDADVQKKVKAVLAAGLVAILCVGETLEQRKTGKTMDITLGQVKSAFAGLAAHDLSQIIIAYEPVWAIGTGMTAQPEDAEEVHAAIRKEVSALFDHSLANRIRILYGGSVKPDNAASLLAQPDVDGALVGGASLTSDSFLAISKAAG